MPEPLRIAYLVEDTAQSGGVRVQLAQADALIARGHRVRMVTKGLPLTWRSSRAEWVYVDDFRQYDAGEDDFVVATFWSTVEPAWNIARDRAVHLSQGYEGAFTAYESIRPQIEAAYQLKIPKLVVGRSLIPILERFTDDITGRDRPDRRRRLSRAHSARERADARAVVRRIAGGHERHPRGYRPRRTR
jgi:hypothetical protein